MKWVNARNVLVLVMTRTSQPNLKNERDHKLHTICHSNLLTLKDPYISESCIEIKI